MALFRSCRSRHTRSVPGAFSKATKELTNLVGVVTLAITYVFPYGLIPFQKVANRDWYPSGRMYHRNSIRVQV